jgi:hypothetical protein
LKCRLIEHVAQRASLHVDWGDDCPNHYGLGKPGSHVAVKVLGDGPPDADEFAGHLDDYSAPENWPDVCAYCGRPVPKDGTVKVNLSLGYRRVYNTASGDPEPGDMFWAPWYHGELKQHYCPWDNCSDPRGHLMVVLPNGHIWDVDGRASNCDMKEDRTHRCWVRHGDPPNVHVYKNGHTCHAGAGSILSGNYHGFLHNGELTNC